MSNLLDHIEIETRPNPEISVIWLHGLGADGNDFVPIVQELDLAGLPGIRFLFPHAPTMPVTINGGYVMRAWYDILGTELIRQEDEGGLRSSQKLVEAFIAHEKARGIPAARIILAGFSQGCAMTLQAGLRHPEQLAGMICMSGYLPLHTVAAAERTVESTGTPIFMAHGRMDPVVPYVRGTQSRDLLQQLGYQIEWHEYPMQHSVCAEEVADLSAWLKKTLS
ncbi:alpha/beta hydrolase [Massilia arenosa]|uniref:Alpha/beta hydrolase n=1 Tax=Zemynaea arenosa TaxID=2561931 RepID=A0A4Y9RT46_9BURK|nr:alpha/beta hydrolase [Massilia arenosa]TFW10709.1 alpha/beta hydrolase [Massilia arenosa]